MIGLHNSLKSLLEELIDEISQNRFKSIQSNISAQIKHSKNPDDKATLKMYNSAIMKCNILLKLY